MGGSLSEPATLADLGEDVWRMYSSAPFRQKLGWHIPHLSGEQTIQGLQHVDDALIFSKVLCRECLFAGVQNLWPADVGTTLEGHGLPMQFLHGRIEEADGDLVVLPYSHNSDFARGLSDRPERAKFPNFAYSPQLVCFDLRALLLERILSFNVTAEGNAARAAVALVDTVTEVAILQWPWGWICRILQNVPRRRKSPFVSLVRLYGRVLRSFMPSLSALCTPHPDSTKQLHAELLDVYLELCYRTTCK